MFTKINILMFVTQPYDNSLNPFGVAGYLPHEGILLAAARQWRCLVRLYELCTNGNTIENIETFEHDVETCAMKLN